MRIDNRWRLEVEQRQRPPLTSSWRSLCGSFGRYLSWLGLCGQRRGSRGPTSYQNKEQQEYCQRSIKFPCVPHRLSPSELHCPECQGCSSKRNYTCLGRLG